MSAYIVSDNHINVIASYFASPIHGNGLWSDVTGEWGYLTPDVAHLLAHVLHHENVRSVDHRYRENNGDEMYQFTYIRDAHSIYKPEEIAQALDGLEYQSCEREDYHQSEAWKYMNAMRKHLLREIADREIPEDVSYWHIDEVKQLGKAAV